MIGVFHGRDCQGTKHTKNEDLLGDICDFCCTAFDKRHKQRERDQIKVHE